MTQKDIERKQIIFIEYLQDILNEYATNDWKVKAEYSTNDNDSRVITVQEVQGQKIVFYGDCTPLFNYYMIDIYGLSIQENKNISLLIGNLIGKSVLIDVNYTDDRIGVIAFNLKNREYEDVAIKMATERGISLRAGKFCAHPYVYRLLGVSDCDAYRDIVSGNHCYGMVRASLGLYNTKEEADAFLNQLDFIANRRSANRICRKPRGKIRF